MKRAAIIGASIGAVIPLVIWFSYMFFGYMAGPETVILWPSSIVLMSLENQHSLKVAAAVWVGSALVNVALYMLIAVCCYGAYRIVTKGSRNA